MKISPLIPKYSRSIMCIIAMLSTISCVSLSGRTEHAAEIAQAGRLTHKYIQAKPFILTSWQRLSATNAPIHIYIEGDGLAWLSRSTPSNNPTPKNPVALELASRDLASNVVYIARPCQYTPMNQPNNHCERSYWTAKRYSREVIDSYHAALNTLSNRNGGAKFHLTGFSGGANIAGLLAAERKDVLSLKTVAGNVDNDFFTKFHNVSNMPDSLNMANYSNKLMNIPQIHFIAEEDKFVPYDIYKHYASRLEGTSCVRAYKIESTTHLRGWGDMWSQLNKQKPRCND